MYRFDGIWAILLIIVVVFFLFAFIMPFLLPLLLVFAIMSIIGTIRTRFYINKTRKEAEKLYEQQRDAYEKTSIQRGDVIDAEYEEREE